MESLDVKEFSNYSQMETQITNLSAETNSTFSPSDKYSVIEHVPDLKNEILKTLPFIIGYQSTCK